MSFVTSLRHEAGRRIRNIRRPRIFGCGHDFVSDVRERLSLPVRTIFDVGAHVGMTALEYGDEFPEAEVWAFEPHPGNMAQLKANLVGKPAVRTFEIGLSDKLGTMPFHFDPEHPSMARLTSDGEMTIALDTIDRFAGAHGVRKIDLLKIDVEGHEQQVLAGASGMLGEGSIHIIRLETAIDPDQPYHTQLPDICNILHPFGYRLFGFYDQWENMIDRSPKLGRFDAVFISPHLR